jgi:hypothetical protein
MMPGATDMESSPTTASANPCYCDGMSRAHRLGLKGSQLERVRQLRSDSTDGDAVRVQLSRGPRTETGLLGEQTSYHDSLEHAGSKTPLIPAIETCFPGPSCNRTLPSANADILASQSMEKRGKAAGTRDPGKQPLRGKGWRQRPAGKARASQLAAAEQAAAAGGFG